MALNSPLCFSCVFITTCLTTGTRQHATFCKAKLGMQTKTPYLCKHQFCRIAKNISRMHWRSASSKPVGSFSLDREFSLQPKFFTFISKAIFKHFCACAWLAHNIWHSSANKAGLTPMLPMQLHWAPCLWGPRAMVFRQFVHFCRIPYSLRLRIVESTYKCNC